MKDIVKIYVDWDCPKSIKRAETDKKRVENKGYKLINQFGGIFQAVLIYAK